MLETIITALSCPFIRKMLLLSALFLSILINLVALARLRRIESTNVIKDALKDRKIKKATRRGK